jgi:GNAT superfamily N-acetyltransferase
VSHWAAERPFFDPGTRPADILVAWDSGRMVGYLKLRRYALRPSAHVQEIRGMAVEPVQHGRGVGRLRLEAARHFLRGEGAPGLAAGPGHAKRRAPFRTDHTAAASCHSRVARPGP